MATPASVKERSFLTAGYGALALRLQETQASELSNGDVCRRLSDCLRDTCAGTGSWCYYIDHFGDSESGDVVYSMNGDTFKAPYSITSANGKAACMIDTENAVDVVPRTVYEEEAEDEDHYASMESAKLYLSKTEVPLYERFISKDERKAAGSGSFAGKGKSFPILKPADVMAAVRAMGRAGSENHSAGTLKANIIKIAKAKGWEKELPKSWQGDGIKESADQSNANSPAAIRLTESALFSADIPLQEAFREGYRIKLISPGKGSSAYYTEAALKLAVKDGIFRAGTPMRIDHPTAAESAARPEGSVKDWGAVLKGNAVWMESGPAGPGVYGEVKPFSDHVQTIEEKGPYAGVSICAWGDPLMENGKPVMRDGVPVIERFTRADGVDMVTRAGAGGMFLTEAARAANLNEGGADDMDAAQFQKLQESLALREANEKKLLERAIKGDAREYVARTLKPLSLHEAGKELVADTVLRGEIPAKEGALDEAAFKLVIEAEAQRVGKAFGQVSGPRIVGMGASAVQVTEQDAARAKADQEREFKEAVRAYRDIGMPEEAAKRAAGRYQEVA